MSDDDLLERLREQVDEWPLVGGVPEYLREQAATVEEAIVELVRLRWVARELASEIAIEMCTTTDIVLDERLKWFDRGDPASADASTLGPEEQR